MGDLVLCWESVVVYDRLDGSVVERHHCYEPRGHEGPHKDGMWTWGVGAVRSSFTSGTVERLDWVRHAR